MILIGKEKHTRVFSPQTAPAVTVKSGEVVVLETEDTAGGQIRSETDTFTTIDQGLMNPCTGPIAVEEAQPGDILAIDILAVHLPARGFVATNRGVGIARSRASEAQTRFVTIKEGMIHFRSDLCFPVKPHCGIIGVAPERDEIPVFLVGDHGGNMDNNLVGPGATLYLPVATPGALLSVGDVHAVMGDGEMFGSPVEVGARVELRLSVLKGRPPLKGPVVETKACWSVAGWSLGEDLLAALEMAAERILDFLQSAWGLTQPEAMMLLTCIGDLQFSAACLGAGYVATKVTVPKLAGRPPFIRR